MKKILVFLMVATLIFALPTLVMAKQEGKNNSNASAAGEKSSPRVAFKGVVIRVLPNEKILDVVLVEPFLRILARKINAGTMLKVNYANAEFLRDGEKLTGVPANLEGAYLGIRGTFDLVGKKVDAVKIHILRNPPGRIIGTGIIKEIKANSFVLEMKARKEGDAPVLREFFVLPRTIFRLHETGEVKFSDMKVGMRAAVKGFNHENKWNATFVVLGNPK